MLAVGLAEGSSPLQARLGQPLLVAWPRAAQSPFTSGCPYSLGCSRPPLQGGRTWLATPARVWQ
ncbi:hypothetical protein B296_00005370 [Ensete ventricosum]|uniref:Uncharacterized protein n=1 Tax=Ensete ventricosum TaxID=4639 RepID=A0A426ZBR5_ENSVE|nr:hypothetical protein B296_00005370 [Ensete ventricosum]